METIHKIIHKSSAVMEELKSESVDLMITSPPYPMIEMWDEIFSSQNGSIRKSLDNEQGEEAFELMHKELDPVWEETYRVLKQGGIVCINIGDATRTIGKNFQLYNNHSRIINHCLKVGFQTLPAIIWRKQTNAPNKFMGSGMLPPGAYVTLEHEYIVLLRKGKKREFKLTEKNGRQGSAYFWEERNLWFSDLWMDMKGTGQTLTDKAVRSRSGAFPFELPYRLINMFSVVGDTVLDPFLGTGTTMLAAMSLARQSVGYELDPNFGNIITSQLDNLVSFANNYINKRLQAHVDFVEKRLGAGKELKKTNNAYGFPCISGQEEKLLFKELESLEETDKNHFKVSYHAEPQAPLVYNKINGLCNPPAKKAVKTKSQDGLLLPSFS